MKTFKNKYSKVKKKNDNFYKRNIKPAEMERNIQTFTREN